MESWYALHVRSNMERRIESRLDEVSIQHFSPFVPNLRRRQGGSNGHGRHAFERTETALMPGYVFARLDLERITPNHYPPFALHLGSAWLRLPEALRLVGIGYQPLAIPDIEVESLRILIASKATISSVPLVAAGDYVRVVAGPMKDAEGYVVNVRGKNREAPRIMVMISGMGRSFSAEVDGDCLEKANPPVVRTAPAKGKVLVMPSRVVVVPQKIAA